MTDVRKLTVHEDARGWVAEILRPEHTDGHIKGQFYVTVAKPGITKAKHYHTRKTEWFCAISGSGVIRLKDIETGKITDGKVGKGNMVVVKVVPNVAHSIINTGDEDLVVLGYITEPFNEKDPDTFPCEL